MRAQTYAFTVLGMSQLFHAVGMRDIHRSVFRMNHLENKWMIVAFILGFVLQISVTEIPVLIQAFGTVHLELHEWIRLTILAAFPILAHELMVFLQKPEKDVCNQVKMESIRIDR
jgi:Ca2+-transporting ATPase